MFASVLFDWFGVLVVLGVLGLLVFGCLLYCGFVVGIGGFVVGVDWRGVDLCFVDVLICAFWLLVYCVGFLV